MYHTLVVLICSSLGNLRGTQSKPRQNPVVVVVAAAAVRVVVLELHSVRRGRPVQAECGWLCWRCRRCSEYPAIHWIGEQQHAVLDRRQRQRQRSRFQLCCLKRRRLVVQRLLDFMSDVWLDKHLFFMIIIVIVILYFLFFTNFLLFPFFLPPPSFSFFSLLILLLPPPATRSS